MDAMTFIRQAVTQAHERLMASLEGLTEADVTWRPAANANTILEIAWHVARADDRLGRRRTGLGPELWDRDGWSERLGSVRNVSAGEAYQFLKDQGAQPPRLDDVKGVPGSAAPRYPGEAVRPDARRPRRRAGPAAAERTVATYFRHMITHKNNHHGQIDFIRGLRHSGWELTPGAGIVQRG
jgi:hypothetical protein